MKPITTVPIDDWERCSLHGTQRRMVNLKLERTDVQTREIDGEGGKKTKTIETKIYVCTDGCAFAFPGPRPYDGKFGPNPVKRADPPDVPEPPAVAELLAVRAKLLAEIEYFSHNEPQPIALANAQANLERAEAEIAAKYGLVTPKGGDR